MIGRRAGRVAAAGPVRLARLAAAGRAIVPGAARSVAGTAPRANGWAPGPSGSKETAAFACHKRKRIESPANRAQ